MIWKPYLYLTLSRFYSKLYVGQIKFKTCNCTRCIYQEKKIIANSYTCRSIFKRKPNDIFHLLSHPVILCKIITQRVWPEGNNAGKKDPIIINPLFVTRYELPLEKDIVCIAAWPLSVCSEESVAESQSLTGLVPGCRRDQLAVWREGDGVYRIRIACEYLQRRARGCVPKPDRLVGLGGCLRRGVLCIVWPSVDAAEQN